MRRSCPAPTRAASRWGRGASLLFACGLVALASSACNALLDNQRGRLEGDDPTSDDAGTGAPAIDGSAEVADAGAGAGDLPPVRVEDGGAASPDGGDGGPAPPPPPDCKGDQRACAGVCVSKKDPEACGPMCLVCPEPANATALCASDTCSFSCAKNFADCDEVPANGCEASLQKDDANCGKCGVVCGNGYACTRGKCRLLGIFGAAGSDDDD